MVFVLKIMAVDLGDSRTGLACCDRTQLLASPIGVIHDTDFLSVINKVASAVVEYGAQKVIVGYPKNMNNTIGERAKKSEQFAELLREIVNVPVELWDERATTILATNILNTTDTRGKKRKNTIDAVAAVIILESYLSYLSNKERENNGK